MHLGLTQDEFGKSVGVTSQAVSLWINGKRSPSLKTLKVIETTYPNVSPLWLRNGTGNMLKPTILKANENEVPGDRSEYINETGEEGMGFTRFYTSERITGPDTLHEPPGEYEIYRMLLAEKEERIRLLEKLLSMYERGE